VTTASGSRNLARRHPSSTAPDEPTRSCSAMRRGAPPWPAISPRLPGSPNSASPSSRRRSATSKRPRRAAPSCRRWWRLAERAARAARRGFPPDAAHPLCRSPSAMPPPPTTCRSGALGLPHGFAANLVSAGVRAVPLGQTDGQRVIAALASRRSRRRGAPRRHRLHETRNPVHEVVPLMTSAHGPLRVGIGGPVGSGKTALMDALCKRLRDATTSPPSPTTSTPRRTPSS
jgi:hypothetical protein